MGIFFAFTKATLQSLIKQRSCPLNNESASYVARGFPVRKMRNPRDPTWKRIVEPSAQLKQGKSKMTGALLRKHRRQQFLLSPSHFIQQ